MVYLGTNNNRSGMVTYSNKYSADMAGEISLVMKPGDVVGGGESIRIPDQSIELNFLPDTSAQRFTEYASWTSPNTSSLAALTPSHIDMTNGILLQLEGAAGGTGIHKMELTFVYEWKPAVNTGMIARTQDTYSINNLDDVLRAVNEGMKLVEKMGSILLT
jgi:hypothetical protein